MMPVNCAQCLGQVMNGRYKQGRCPELWDGKAAQRIARVIVEGSGGTAD